MKSARLLLIVVASLAVAAAALLAVAALTPWHTDADAYFAGLKAIRAEVYGTGEGVGDFNAASRDFHALQERYRTLKWVYANLGYAAGAWALVLALVSLAPGMLRPTRRPIPILGACGVATMLMVLAGVAGSLQMLGREQLPEWADSVAIPITGGIVFGTLFLPVVLACAIAPVVFTRRDPTHLTAVRGRNWTTSALASLLYLPLLALGGSTIALFWQTGGWLLSPAGAIVLWLALNARAIWLGERPAATALP